MEFNCILVSRSRGVSCVISQRNHFQNFHCCPNFEMKTEIFLLITFLSLASAKVDPSFNEVIDSILNKRTSEDADLDPIKVSDTGFDFQRKIAFVDVRGVAKFSNTTITGLSHLNRVRDIETEKIDEYKTSMTIYLGVKNIKLNMDGVLKFMGVGPSRKFEGVVDNLVLEMQLVYNQLEDEVRVAVLKVSEMGKLDLKAAGGFKVVDAVTNQVLRTALSSFDKLVRYAVELTFSKIAEKFMSQSDDIKRVMSTIS